MNSSTTASGFSARSYRIASPRWMLRETYREDKKEFLEPYFADLHLFFMRRMNMLLLYPAFELNEEQRLKELFAEVIRVKKMLNGRE